VVKKSASLTKNFYFQGVVSGRNGGIVHDCRLSSVHLGSDFRLHAPFKSESIPIGKWCPSDLQIAAESDLGPEYKVCDMHGRDDTVQVIGTSGTIGNHLGNNLTATGLPFAENSPSPGAFRIDGTDHTAFTTAQRTLSMILHFHQSVAHIDQHRANRLH
jgi:hypothetical protein